MLIHGYKKMDKNQEKYHNDASTSYVEYKHYYRKKRRRRSRNMTVFYKEKRGQDNSYCWKQLARKQLVYTKTISIKYAQHDEVEKSNKCLLAFIFFLVIYS